MKVTFCYEEIDEGECTDNGFYDPDYGIKASIYEMEFEETGFLVACDTTAASLRDALEHARNLGIRKPFTGEFTWHQGRNWPPDFNSETWWTSEMDMHTGVYTIYSLHISGITPSTRKRIHNILQEGATKE